MKDTKVTLTYVGGVLPTELAFTEASLKKAGKLAPSGKFFEECRSQNLIFLEDFEISRHQVGWIALGRGEGALPVLTTMFKYPAIRPTRVNFTFEVDGNFQKAFDSIRKWLEGNKPRLARFNEDFNGGYEFGGATSDLSLQLFNGTGYRHANSGYTAIISCRNDFAIRVFQGLKDLGASAATTSPIYQLGKALTKEYLGNTDWFNLAKVDNIVLPDSDGTEYGVSNGKRKAATSALVAKLITEFDGDKGALLLWFTNEVNASSSSEKDVQLELPLPSSGEESTHLIDTFTGIS